MELIKEKFVGITSAELESLYNFLKKDLPSVYVNFLRKNNGLKFNYNSYMGKDEFSIDRLYSLPKELNENIRFQQERLPKNTIPIGCDAGGNEFILDLEKGGVYFWNHEIDDIEVGENPKSLSKLKKLANNFKEFIRNIKIDSSPIDISRGRRVKKILRDNEGNIKGYEYY